MENELQKTLFKIFFPHASSRVEQMVTKKSRFVHYTTAASAMEIIRQKEFWMRDPTCMNDYTEVEHGIRCIDSVYSNRTAGERFRTLLESAHVGITAEIQRQFNQSPLNPRLNNYVACLSEHKDFEDDHGRLSMWRAYGGGAGVALVLHSSPILNGPGVLKLQTSAVAYFEDTHFEEELNKISENLQTNLDLIKRLDPRIVALVTLNMLRLGALSSKHPGFAEELEWRLIYAPDVDLSPMIKKEVVAIGGVAQTVYKIPLASSPHGEITGAEIPNLIDRIIIGPTQYPAAMYKAFVDLLATAGVSDPDKKVCISRIPLRT